VFVHIDLTPSGWPGQIHLIHVGPVNTNYFLDFDLSFLSEKKRHYVFSQTSTTVPFKMKQNKYRDVFISQLNIVAWLVDPVLIGANVTSTQLCAEKWQLVLAPVPSLAQTTTTYQSRVLQDFLTKLHNVVKTTRCLICKPGGGGTKK
jgi:hypothetical protein